MLKLMCQYIDDLCFYLSQRQQLTNGFGMSWQVSRSKPNRIDYRASSFELTAGNIYASVIICHSTILDP